MKSATSFRFLRLTIQGVLVTALAISCGIIATSPLSALAEEQKQELVKISHKPLETHKIPAAGTLMPISVQLQNSTDVDIKIRMIGSRDGRFMDIAFPLGVLDQSDKPTFTIQIPAPVKALTYQFIVHQKNGDLSLSEKFVLKRNCVQNFTVAVPDGAPAAEYKREMANLISQARSLEKETHNLETAIKLLDALQRDIPG